MGWIEKVKEIICGLKASGKNKKEIKQIVQQAADKATVGCDDLGFVIAKSGVKARDAMDAFAYVAYALAVRERYEKIKETNNWRKMHGLPMRRKRRARR